MPITRIIIVQGPLQLLNVISVLRFQAASGEYNNCSDILVMGGYNDQKLNKICLQISRIWDFQVRISLYEFEVLCARNNYDFLKSTDLLKQYINIAFADVIYTCRNWQFINEVFLSAYPQARKICYGDGLGWLDLNNTTFISHPLNPSGFIQIDDSYLISPIEYTNCFGLSNVKQVKPEFFKSTVADSAREVEGLRDYCRQIITQMGNSITIALTSYETEAGFVKNYQDEIKCYLSSLLSYTQIGEVILIKGHPRQQINQSHILAAEVHKYQRQALVVPESFNRVPIELFCEFLPINKAFTYSSSACISIAYLCESEVVIGYGEKIVKEFYKEIQQIETLKCERTFSIAVQQAYTKKFAPIRYIEINKIQEFHQSPIYLKPTNNMQHQIESQATDKDIIKWFHQIYYNAAQEKGLTWQKTYWMGIPVYKCPLDLWIYQEILFDIKPDLIIETGTLFGGSALFLAQMCDLLGQGEIITIDIEDRPNRPQHPRISYWLASSTSEETIEKVREKAANKSSVLVILDSDHTANHVLRELQLYNQFVTPGSYLIVEDTNINGHPVYLNYGPGPMEAVQAFMRENSSFDVDQECEKLYLTFNPSGYLKKRNIQKPDTLGDKFSVYIQDYQKNPSDASAIANLRQLRYQVATELLTVPNSQLESLYMGELGKKQQLLVTIGLKNELLTANEQALVEQVLTYISTGIDEHQRIQYLLVATLYLHPDQLPAPHEITHIPHWFLNDYVTYLFNTHSYFQKIGAADNYYRYIQQWIDYLHNSSLEDHNSQQWNDFLDSFVKNANFIPVYFNEENLKDIYVKRANIIEYFLKMINYAVDYHFPEIPVFKNKIRLGILANNFLPSAETFAYLPVYEYLSRDFEVILYSLVETAHPLEQYCQLSANSFKLLPKELSAQVNIIRADDVDILFIAANVTAVTNQICLLATHRLARIQVASGGSVVTTGMRNIDYYISGTLTDPSPTAQEQYQEKLIKLEGSAHCFSYGTEEGKITTPVERNNLGIPEDAFVFISGANYFKTVPELIETWAKIISQVPNSVLVLLPFGPNWSNNYPKIQFINHLDSIFTKYGLATERLIVLDPQPVPDRQDMKEYYKMADVYLDSFPFSGTTSLIEPLQVNLPVIARQGNCFRSAMGAAMIQTLNIPGLVADSEGSYIKLAVALGNNAELRQQKSYEIKEAMQNNPSFLDSRAYSAKMGNLFQELFGNYLSENLAKNLRLKDINLIIFPDWTQPEDELGFELQQVIQALANHPDNKKITLIIHTGNIATKDAEMFLSSVAMNLLMEDLDITDTIDISLVDKLGNMQWQSLLPRIYGRVILNNEDYATLVQIPVGKLQSYQIDSLIT